MYKGGLIPPESDDFVSDQNLFNYQAKIIKELAAQESCVIVGRCADFILRDRPDVVSVFVHAPMDYRIARSLELSASAIKTKRRWSDTSSARISTEETIITITQPHMG